MIAELRKTVDDCPRGGNFYVCNGFRGCCGIDPCGPNSTCPPDKDTTPLIPAQPSDWMSEAATWYSLPKTTVTVIAGTTTVRPAGSTITTTTSSIPPASSTPAQVTPDGSPILSPAEPTAFKTITHNISGSTTLPTGISASSSGIPEPPSTHPHTAPVAAILGAVLGTVILIATAISLFLFIRKRRRAKLTRVYKAPMYPSPGVGSDMSAQLASKAHFQHKVASLSRAESRTSQDDPQQLDSREISRRQHNLSHISVTQFAELPAEPLPWPGSANT